MALFDPLNSDDVNRLDSAIDGSQEELRKSLLPQRKVCLEAYQGHRFSSSPLKRGVDPRMSIPLMEIAIDLHEQLLAGESHHALVSPRRDRSLTSLGENLKIVLDMTMEAINISDAFRAWVKESIWGWGVAKVGMGFERRKLRGRGGGFNRTVALPFVDVIDMEDLLIDTQANTFNRLRWIGNRYLVPLDWAKESPSFKAGPRSELQAVDPDKNRTLGSAAPVSQQFDRNTLFPLTELRDVYLPLDNLMLTMSTGGPNKVLRHGKWNGPSIGPYHPLTFESVPGTAIGMPLAWPWIDAHDSVNTLYNKAVRQALRSKRNPIVPPGAQSDAERIRKAEDGEYVFATKPETISTFVIPGADPSLVGLTGQLIDVFSYMAGNINLLGGLAAQSPTLGQDQILQGSGSRRMAELQRRAKQAFSGVMSSVAWYLFNDPDLEVSLERKVGNGTVQTFLRHEDIKGQFLEFNFRIEPIRHKSPDERLALLLRWLQQVTLNPALQGEMARQGVSVDVKALHKVGKDMGDLPELGDVIVNLGRQPSPDEQAMMGGGRGSGAASTPDVAGGRSEAAPAGLLAGVGGGGEQETGLV